MLVPKEVTSKFGKDVLLPEYYSERYGWVERVSYEQCGSWLAIVKLRSGRSIGCWLEYLTLIEL